MKNVSNPSDSGGARPHQHILGGIDGTERHARRLSTNRQSRHLSYHQAISNRMSVTNTHPSDLYAMVR
jgi:hypothetical protein